MTRKPRPAIRRVDQLRLTTLADSLHALIGELADIASETERDDVRAMLGEAIEYATQALKPLTAVAKGRRRAKTSVDAEGPHSDATADRSRHLNGRPNYRTKCQMHLPCLIDESLETLS